MPTSDKLPRTVATTASYVAGESPSAAKLTLIGTQLRAAAAALERVLGDVRGQRGPYITETAGTAEQQLQQAALGQIWGRSRTTGDPLTDADVRALDIVNIARLIGPASNLNPRSLEASTVTEPIPVGVHEFALKYPVDIDLTGASEGKYPTAASLANSSVAISGSNLITYVETLADLNAAGEWILDAVKGVVYCYSATTSGGTITYPVDPLKFHGGYNQPGARFNVIPDPNQLAAGGASLTITGPVNGVYTISLPVLQQQQSNENQDSVELTDGVTYKDLNAGQQLKLPAFLDGLDGVAAGTELPAGILLLKHLPTGTIYDGGTYYYNTASSFDLAGVTLPSTTGSDFVVITVGNDITTAIDDLRIKSRHSHNRDFGEPLIHYQDLVGATSIPGPGGGFLPSAIPGNYLPQYLHRDGYQTTLDQNGRNVGNALRGHLAITATDRTFDDSGSVGNKSSFRLYLGDFATYIQHAYDGGVGAHNRGNCIRLMAEKGIYSPNGYIADSFIYDINGRHQTTRFRNPLKFKVIAGQWNTNNGNLVVSTGISPWNATSGSDSFIVSYEVMTNPGTPIPFFRKENSGVSGAEFRSFLNPFGTTQEIILENVSQSGTVYYVIMIWYVEALSTS